MLSICIITRNEEENIGRCLACLSPYPAELVVVDTGSDDGTRAVAAQYTDNVYDFAWCDDFAAAKNYAVSKASNPYVMIIDSDEFIEQADFTKLERLIAEHPGQVGRIMRRNTFTREGIAQENREWINRIFSRDRYRYEGTIHEQVTAVDGSSYRTYEAPIVIRHTGYDLPEEERKKKAVRNITLLQQELTRLGWTGEEAPGGRDEHIPYLLYQLGKGYYMAQDYTQACNYFAHGLCYDLEPKLEYVIDMVETYGYALINSGQADKALFFENIYGEFGDSADFQFLMGLIYMNNARFEDAVAEFLKATGHETCRNQGANSYAAYYNIGVIYECTGRGDEARRYYMKCGGYEPAQKRLEYCDK